MPLSLSIKKPLFTSIAPSNYSKIRSNLLNRILEFIAIKLPNFCFASSSGTAGFFFKFILQCIISLESNNYLPTYEKIFSGQRTVLKACRRKPALYLKSVKEDGISNITNGNRISGDCFNNNQLSPTNHCHDFQKFETPQRVNGKFSKL